MKNDIGLRSGSNRRTDVTAVYCYVGHRPFVAAAQKGSMIGPQHKHKKIINSSPGSISQYLMAECLAGTGSSFCQSSSFDMTGRKEDEDRTKSVEDLTSLVTQVENHHKLVIHWLTMTMTTKTIFCDFAGLIFHLSVILFVYLSFHSAD